MSSRVLAHIMEATSKVSCSSVVSKTFGFLRVSIWCNFAGLRESHLLLQGVAQENFERGRLYGAHPPLPRNQGSSHLVLWFNMVVKRVCWFVRRNRKNETAGRKATRRRTFVALGTRDDFEPAVRGWPDCSSGVLHANKFFELFSFFGTP